VQDVLGWLAAGMTQQEILQDYPDLTHADLLACLRLASGLDSCARRLNHCCGMLDP